jgi:uncharacterized protein
VTWSWPSERRQPDLHWTRANLNLQAPRILTIRPISGADRAEVLRINSGSRPAVAALDAAELNRLLSLGNDHRVAVGDDGAVLGYLLAFDDACSYDGEEFQYFRAQLPRPFLYVDQLAVDPECKGRGIGRKFYEALIALAKARHIERLCCEVNLQPPNPDSFRFHRRLGFNAIGNGDTLDGRRVAFLVRSV